LTVSPQRRKLIQIGFASLLNAKRGPELAHGQDVELRADATREVTALLNRWQQGESAALDGLMPLVYNELRRIAARYLHAERSDHTLQTTALVHEAYLRLVDETHIQWQGRAHFYGVAATLIRNILVDHARTHNALKRGAGANKVSMDHALAIAANNDVDLLALDDALRELARADAQQARIVELRFFAGLTIQETAEVLGISNSTVKRDWAMAKTWIYRALSQSASET
jgi:RNA polymerase sigma factor (TIGR02999 family)